MYLYLYLLANIYIYIYIVCNIKYIIHILLKFIYIYILTVSSFINVLADLYYIIFINKLKSIVFEDQNLLTKIFVV